MKNGNPVSDLTVEAIVDLRANSNSIHADSYLTTLSEAEWTDLRETATRTGRTDNPLLRCGDCGKAVYARESWRGRRHCYHFSGDHSDCRWSGAVARHIRSIDAAKFHGQQEGEQHKMLSRLVAEVLSLDPLAREAGIPFRRYTKLADGRYGYPDVYTDWWQGGPAAFEIQLSTTHMPVIVRREEIYKDSGIRLVWIVGHHGRGLSRRAFRDIYMRNDGQIFGMDGEVAEKAREVGEPRFRLYRLLPGPAQEGFAPRWHERIVAPSEINWGAPGDRPRSAELCYDSYLDEMVEGDAVLAALRRDFYNALRVADETSVGAAWDAVAAIVGRLRWNALPSSFDDVRALGVLATLRLDELCVPTQIRATDVTNLVNSMLLEPQKRRCWTHAFELLCRAKGLDELLIKSSIRAKCERNKGETSPSVPIDSAAGPVFNVFFPEGAFYRVTLDDEHMVD